LIGSPERFIEILIEHYAGMFPLQNISESPLMRRATVSEKRLEMLKYKKYHTF
jgi:threonyl-tRNA synthetase